MGQVHGTKEPRASQDYTEWTDPDWEKAENGEDSGWWTGDWTAHAWKDTM